MHIKGIPHINKRAACTLAALGVMLALTAGLVTGCGQKREPAQSTVFAMDTVMNLTIYGVDQQSGQQALNWAVEEIYQLDGQMSATNEDSPIYALNHAQGAWVELPELYDVLTSARQLCEQTGGALDLTAYPAVEAWGFISGDYRVPTQAELEELAGRIDYEAIELSETAARLPEGMEVDLGAVAKGYAGDILAEELREMEVTSALLDLGQSTIQTIGAKPDGSPWRVAVQDPEGQGYLGVLELSDLAVGTSGGYQRYFEQDGETYWHIIDPDTAAPARSGLTSVTVVSSSGLVCDGLSTALFVMGLEEGAQFWREHPELEFEVLFVTDKGELYLTPGMDKLFELGQGYEDREVTVLS